MVVARFPAPWHARGPSSLKNWGGIQTANECNHHRFLYFILPGPFLDGRLRQSIPWPHQQPSAHYSTLKNMRGLLIENPCEQDLLFAFSGVITALQPSLFGS